MQQPSPRATRNQRALPIASREAGVLVVAVVLACCITLTALLARTPLAVPLTGRKQQPWSTLIPRRERAETVPAEPDLADAGYPPPAELAGATNHKNGL